VHENTDNIIENQFLLEWQSSEVANFSVKFITEVAKQ